VLPIVSEPELSGEVKRKGKKGAALSSCKRKGIEQGATSMQRGSVPRKEERQNGANKTVQTLRSSDN